MTRHLDLGCGPNPKNPYGFDELWGIDIRAPVLMSQKSSRLTYYSNPFHFPMTTLTVSLPMTFLSTFPVFQLIMGVD